MTLRTIAEKAWKDAPQGLSTLDGFRVFKTRKMLLVHEAPYVERHFDNYLHKLVAFPRPEHLGQFASAAESVEAGGENKSNPGAIGELHFRVANSRIYLSFVQANFKVGKTGLPRNLATLYGGWRENSLRGLFQFAR
ncbi:TPA: hypothetical protein HA244_06565, partial [Candidatus Micrarchaeota archaeon]|nr:hypothetical protein [Candidatus Micrarchaeota archaeon]